MSDAHWLTATEIAAAYAARHLSPVELVRALLDRIAALDPRVHAFIKVDAEAALDTARLAEREIAAGRTRGRLHGVPVGIKDIIDVARLPTTCHSKLLLDHVATADAEVTARLRAAGAVILGKLALHRTRHRRPRLRPAVPARAQPVKHASPSGGLIRRLRRRPRRGARAAGARHRYGRIRPQPRRRVRRGRAEADVWAGVAPRRVPARLHARSRGPHGALRRRRRAPARPWPGTTRRIPPAWRRHRVGSGKAAPVARRCAAGRALGRPLAAREPASAGRTPVHRSHRRHASGARCGSRRNRRPLSGPRAGRTPPGGPARSRGSCRRSEPAAARCPP